MSFRDSVYDASSRPRNIFQPPRPSPRGGSHIRLFLALVLTLALAVPAAASECIPTTSHPEVSAFGFYVDNDLCQVPPGDPSTWQPPALFDWYGGGGDSCLFSIWTYEESNGIVGLQRGDEVHDDTCGGMIESDTLAFF